MLEWFRTHSLYSAARNKRIKLRKSKQHLTRILESDIKTLESGLNSDEDAGPKHLSGHAEICDSKSYTRGQLARVLMACANYYLYLKLTDASTPDERALTAYLSPNSPRETVFLPVAKKIVGELGELASDDPMRDAKLNELANLFTYLLHLMN